MYVKKICAKLLTAILCLVRLCSDLYIIETIAIKLGKRKNSSQEKKSNSMSQTLAGFFYF